MSMKAYERLTEAANASLIPMESPLMETPPNDEVQQFYKVDCAIIEELPVVTYTITEVRSHGQ